MSRRVLARAAPRTPTSGTSIVTDPLEMRRLLLRATSGRTASSIKLRESGGTDAASEKILLQGKLMDMDGVDPSRDGIRLKLSSVPEDGALAALQGRECMLLVYLQGRSILGIHGVPAEIREGVVSLPAPKRLFKIQRRKDVRFEIPAAYEFTVEMDSIEQKGTRVRKRIVDLSESGLSFFVLSPREAALFRRGTFLHRCVIRMQNQTIETSLKIRNQLPIRRDGHGAGNKIGTEFEDILPENREYIGQFVYSHAAHLFY